MKILFVREKWADGDESKGESDGSYLMSTTLHEVFWYDAPEFVQGIASVDDALLAEVQKHFPDLPDVIFFSHLLSLGEKNVKKSTWQTLRNAGVKVVGVWHEGIAPDVVRVADEHAEFVDYNMFLDTKSQFNNYSKFPEKNFGIYDPRSATEFKPLTKDIGMLFNGTLVGRVPRCAGLFTLLANGVPVTKIGGRNELFMVREEMVDCLGRALICLNFADAGPYRHYKGRVAEALLSGCLLLEQDNPETSTILEPFKHYVPFGEPEDLLAKAKYYLTHPAETEKIAKAGRERALEILDGRQAWKEIFDKLGMAEK